MCFCEIHVCVRLWENRGMKKYILRLNVELLIVFGYDCPHPRDVPVPGTDTSFLSDPQHTPCLICLFYMEQFSSDSQGI
jgi:hypothetical protein